MKTFRGIFTITFLTFFVAGYLQLNAQENKHKPITKKLILLLDKKTNLKKMLMKSIAKAKKINPDKKTNPVQSIYQYYNFIDETSELIPRQVLKDPENLTRDQILQSICYFYFLIDQPLEELKDEKQFKNTLQFYDEFSPWLREFAITWGKFLDTEDSWGKKYYQEFKKDPAYGLRTKTFEPPENWKTFNQFFSRKLRLPSERPIASPDNPRIVTSPTDSIPQGVWEISKDSKIKVEKGLEVKLAKYYNISDLLSEDSEYKNEFSEGKLTHTFLNVNDYHRFHFPVGGEIKEIKIISKNVALEVSWDKSKGKYVPIDSTGWQFTQTRGYVIVDTVEYGLVVLMPMGMAQVSSVNFEKNITIGSKHKKGDPLGKFLFGGSDFIMIFQKLADFQITAPKTETEGTYAHILTGEEYGILKGNNEHLQATRLLKELDDFAISLKLPKLSSVDSSVTKSDVDLMIYRELQEAGIPAFEESKFRIEAEKKYPLWKIGDEVSVIDNKGFKHKGKFLEKNSKYIKVGNKRIFSIDFTEKILPHINEEYRNSIIEKYVKEKKRIFLIKKRNFKAKLRKKTKEKFYNKYGFVNRSDKWLDYETYKGLLIKSLERRKKKIEALKAKEKAEGTAESDKKTEKK